MPEINTLVQDIYGLFDPKVEHTVNEEYIEEFGENIKDILRDRLKGRGEFNPTLRFSNLGKPDRQVWYAHRHEGEPMLPKTYLKFLYGDIIEQMVLFLCKEAGHKVELEQAEVVCEGIKGHIDAIIDDVVIDVKSASPFSFKKFEDGSVVDDDPFGYIQQLSGYNAMLGRGNPPAFLAFDKVSADVCVSTIPQEVAEAHPPADRIRHLKEVVASETPPERCYEPVPDGKSGNMKLGTGCSYCNYKKECWPNLRTFLYSNGPRFLTHVEREPDVFEV